MQDVSEVQIDAPVLICGTGRSGTTFLASVLSIVNGFLWVEEPNFVTHLIIPYVIRRIDWETAVNLLDNEGWRGPMKVCRTLSEMYPEHLGDKGRLPIRTYLRAQLMSYLIKTRYSSTAKRDKESCRLLDEVMAMTLRVTGRKKWLIKQPSALEYWDTLLKYCPELKVICVSRDLPRVILSRVKRGYQSSLSEALALCRRRLIAAEAMWRALGSERMIIIKIEHVADDANSTLTQICDFLGSPRNSKIQKAINKIDRRRLEALGTPAREFSAKEMTAVETVRDEINTRFGHEIV